MTETITVSPAPPDDPVAPVHVAPTSPRRFDAVPWLLLLGVVILAAALTWLYRNPHNPARASIVQNDARVPALQAQVTALTRRLESLEHRASPQADLSGLTERVAALESRPAAAVAAPPAQPDAASQQSVDALATRMAELDRQVDAATHAAAEIRRTADHAARLARLQQAAAALDAGRPLGALPGAPPALHRFADTAPPTEAGLRLRFPEIAESARAASRPTAPGRHFWRRVWARAEASITLRQGDTILVGDPAAGVIEAARAKLDAGDLAGTVATLDQLTGPSAAAVRGWADDAQALLDARAALADAELRG